MERIHVGDVLDGRRGRGGLAATAAIQPERWDRDPWIIGAPDGRVLDVSTGTPLLRAPRPGEYVRAVLEAMPEECDLDRMPLWRSFLDTLVDDELELRFVQRFFASALFKWSPKRICLLVGDSDSGKTSFFKILETLLPRGNTLRMPKSEFTKTERSSQARHSQWRSGFRDARAAWMDDVTGSLMLSEFEGALGERQRGRHGGGGVQGESGVPVPRGRDLLPQRQPVSRMDVQRGRGGGETADRDPAARS